MTMSQEVVVIIPVIMAVFEIIVPVSMVAVFLLIIVVETVMTSDICNVVDMTITVLNINSSITSTNLDWGGQQQGDRSKDGCSLHL